MRATASLPDSKESLVLAVRDTYKGCHGAGKAEVGLKPRPGGWLLLAK